MRHSLGTRPTTRHTHQRTTLGCISSCRGARLRQGSTWIRCSNSKDRAGWEAEMVLNRLLLQLLLLLLQQRRQQPVMVQAMLTLQQWLLQQLLLLLRHIIVVTIVVATTTTMAAAAVATSTTPIEDKVEAATTIALDLLILIESCLNNSAYQQEE